jgi:hypothetical protein
MLVGTPPPVKLSVFAALGPALWIRRVLACACCAARAIALGLQRHKRQAESLP